MDASRPSISVVVPVYNSAAILPRLVERLEPVLRTVASEYELILVNDGSRDPSWEVVTQCASMHDWIRGIDLMRNYGQHNALLCGIREARGELTLTIDDDLQHPPEEIPKLLAALTPDYDVVYATPLHEQHGLWRNLASQVTKLVLQSTMGAATARQVSAFRLFRTELRGAFANYQSQYVSIDVLLTWGSSRFRAIPVRHEARAAGTSNYTVRKLLRHSLNMLTGFSTVPLRLASLVGFGFTLFGMGVLAHVLGRYALWGSPVQGFTFLASVIALFSGAQLFALGILGEYLARMHFRVMDHPAYAVRSTARRE